LTAASGLVRRIIPSSLKPLIRRGLGLPKPYNPYIAASIEEQTITFRWRDRLFTVTADRTTPLYETIAEIVDYDCYQLANTVWPNRRGYIVDIGANIGITALVLSQFPCKQVICFEPLPSNCDALESNLARNGVENVRVIRSAVSDVQGPGWIEVATASVGGKLALPTTADRPTIPVQCVRLQDVLALCGDADIDLLKIDCEGGEFAIVDQITPEIADRVRVITFEVHDLDSRRNRRTLASKLSRLGYRLQFKADIFERVNLHHILAVRPNRGESQRSPKPHDVEHSR
jgi:FkbM family methyltransferase